MDTHVTLALVYIGTRADNISYYLFVTDDKATQLEFTLIA